MLNESDAFPNKPQLVVFFVAHFELLKWLRNDLKSKIRCL